MDKQKKKIKSLIEQLENDARARSSNDAELAALYATLQEHLERRFCISDCLIKYTRQSYRKFCGNHAFI